MKTKDFDATQFKTGTEFKKWFVKHPTFLRDDRWIATVYLGRDFREVVLEMGPNCNLSCAHCSLYCGPDKKGLPDLENTVKLLDDASRIGIPKVVLTAGEPLREENRGIIREVSRFSKFIKPVIMSNGTFASTFESAVDWLEFMKSSGLDFSRRGELHVSVGATYAVPKSNYTNINRAIMKVYPDAEWGNFFGYIQLNGPSLKANRRSIGNIDVAFDNTFGPGKMADISWKGADHPVINMYPSGRESAVELYCASCSAKGRAKSIKGMGKIEPEQEIKPEEIYLIDTRDGEGIEAGFDGNISFTDCRDMYRERRYGNIKTEILPVILDRMREDPLFNGFKLGGIALLYYVARQVRPGLVVRGRTAWDVSKVVRGDLQLADEVREYLREEGVVDTYRRFVDGIDFRKRQNIGV